MTIDNKQILKFLKENVVSLNEAEDEPEKKDEDLKEGDQAKAKDSDGNMVTGEIVEIHDEKARLKDKDGEIHVVERADLEKVSAVNESKKNVLSEEFVVFSKVSGDPTKTTKGHLEPKKQLMKQS